MDISRYIRTMLVATCLCLVSNLAVGYVEYDPSTMSFPVSPQQAQATLEASWTEGAVATLLGVSSSLSSVNEYVCQTHNGNRHYAVDCDTGEVRSWVNLPLYQAYYDRRQSENPGVELDEQTIRQIALQYASTHYQDFNQLNMQSVLPRTFFRVVSNGVWDPGCRVTVGIDRYTGDVYNYRSGRAPDPIVSTVQTISQAEAEAIAVGVFEYLPEDPDHSDSILSARSVIILENGGLGIDRLDDADNIQRLAWSIDVVATNEENYTMQDYLADKEAGCLSPGMHRIVGVDAHTGEAYYVDCYLGGGPEPSPASLRPVQPTPFPKRGHMIAAPKCNLYLGENEVMTTFPPRLIDGVPYVYARHLTLLPGWSVRWSKGAVVVKGKGESTFYPGKKTARVDGKEIRFSHPTQILFGRAYIPLEAVNKVTDGAFSWNQQRKIVQVKTKNQLAVSGQPS